jgi:hypothetical protein
MNGMLPMHTKPASHSSFECRNAGPANWIIPGYSLSMTLRLPRNEFGICAMAEDHILVFSAHPLIAFHHSGLDRVIAVTRHNVVTIDSGPARLTRVPFRRRCSWT